MLGSRARYRFKNHNRGKHEHKDLRKRLLEHTSTLTELQKIMKTSAIAAAAKNYYIWDRDMQIDKREGIRVTA